MSNTQVSPTPTPNITDDEFYTLIERLKAQGALPRDSFAKEIPFFTFKTITKESQIRELFQDACDPQLYKNLLKNIVSTPENSELSDLVSKRLSVMQVMSFAQITLYKILPCPEANCPNRPREIATHNQYKDYEYQCPFYHHDRDCRRSVITTNIGEEFTYKANYFEEGKHGTDKDKYSQNYFESMFHPLYYKMFRCKREYCNFSQICPFYHSEEEKKTWDKTFSNYIRKDRISYVKDKFKYFENKNASGGQVKPEKEGDAPRTPKQEKGGFKKDGNRRYGKEPNKEREGEKPKSKNFQGKKWDDWKKETTSLTSLSPKSDHSKDCFNGKSSLPSSMKVL
jgi:hypothetical protein